MKRQNFFFLGLSVLVFGKKIKTTMSVAASIKITQFMKKIIFDQFATNSFWNFQGNSFIFDFEEVNSRGTCMFWTCGSNYIWVEICLAACYSKYRLG